jgi:hypothetical protein
MHGWHACRCRYSTDAWAAHLDFEGFSDHVGFLLRVPGVHLWQLWLPLLLLWLLLLLQRASKQAEASIITDHLLVSIRGCCCCLLLLQLLLALLAGLLLLVLLRQLWCHCVGSGLPGSFWALFTLAKVGTGS